MQPLCSPSPEPLVLRHHAEHAYTVCVLPESSEADRFAGAVRGHGHGNRMAACGHFFDRRVEEPEILRRLQEEQDFHDAVLASVPDNARRTSGKVAASSGTTVAPPMRSNTRWAACRW